MTTADTIDAAQATPRKEAGDIVGGYRLVRPLGEGGMARVWLGEAANGALAAIKLLSETASESMRELFAREKKALLRLQHPNLLPIFDLGDDYIVTAYIEGQDLKGRLRSPLSVHEAIEISCAVASALHTVHETGIVHCDVKPANILLDQDQTPFLADFGIARFSADAVEAQPAKAQGTPGYMAPEQHLGRASAHSDQFGLAKTLLAMLGGEPRRHLSENLALLADDIVESLGPVLERALAPEHADRYTSMSQFLVALRRARPSGDVADARLAPVTRQRRYPWSKGHRPLERIGAHIVRADYSLCELEEAGLLDASAVAHFRDRTGYADFGWSIYLREERLGPVGNEDCLSRCKQSVVLLHGLFADRSLWQDVAVGAVRDNALAVVLVPDIMGFGESIFDDDLPEDILAPAGVVTTMNAWLELIGMEELPTALVGHSYSATALMCARTDDLVPGAHRICITPVFFYYSWRLRLEAITNAALSLFAFSLPRILRHRLARTVFRREPSLRDTPLWVRDDMAERAMRLGARRVATLFFHIGKARPAPADELTQLTVVTSPDDPLVTKARAEASIEATGIPRSCWYDLVYGGHFPHLVEGEHPEWGARNLHELVSLIDRALEHTRREHKKASRPSATDQSCASSQNAATDSASTDAEADTVLLP